MLMKPHWQHFSHEADIGIRGFGRTLAEAFSQAGVALTAVVTEPHRVAPEERLHIELDAAEPDLLFVDWINRLVYEMAVSNRLFCRFDVGIDETGLHADVWGEHVDRERHEPAVEVKGATLTELQVQAVGNQGYVAQCVVDV